MKQAFFFLGRLFRQMDKLMLLTAAALSALSVLLLLGINDSGYVRLRVVQVQMIATLLGLLVALAVTAFDYRLLASLWKFYAPLVVLLNLYTAFFGDYREGTSNRSWLDLGFVSIQPSEFLKIAFILTFSYHLSQVRETLNTSRTLLPLLAHGGAAVGLILLQGDVGVAVIMAAIFVVMLFMAGLSRKLIFAGIGAFSALLPLAWIFFLSPYQKNRILALLYPDQYALSEAHQQLEGLLSIGSGQIFGIGVFSDSHNYVPEMYNDFIFTFLGEAFGFIGCFVVLAAYAFICMRILKAALQSRDYLGRYLCIGVFAMLMAQIFVNISMCLMLMPVIGVTLPLLSAGGSSVLSVYAGLGLVLSVGAAGNRNMFSE